MSATDEQIRQALEALHDGELIVFPTETLYGIGCDALNPEAVEKLCEIKKRPAGKPLAVILGEASMVDQLTGDFSAAASQLADAFWPGPLTLVVPARPGLPDAIVGDQTIGLRVSSDPVAARLSRELGRPICAPSANPTGLPPGSGCPRRARLLRQGCCGLSRRWTAGRRGLQRGPPRPSSGNPARRSDLGGSAAQAAGLARPGSIRKAVWATGSRRRLR